MEVYRRETEEIIRRFLAGYDDREQCVSALYLAFNRVLPELKPEDPETLVAIVRDNEQTVKVQTARRRTCAQAVN